MKTLLSIALITISILSFAQTDIIEMRSRNASLKKYERTIKSNSSDHVASNFGAIPMQSVKTAVLDSVKHESDSVVIMYTRECTYLVRRRFGRTVDEQRRDLEIAKEYNTSTDGTTEEEVTEESPWSPGADTIAFHPLFKHQHSLDSIKRIVDRDYNFVLPADSIEFIGYDNANELPNQQFVESGKMKNEKKNSIGWELIFMLATPILFLLGMSKLVFPKNSN